MSGVSTFLVIVVLTQLLDYQAPKASGPYLPWQPARREAWPRPTDPSEVLGNVMVFPLFEFAEKAFRASVEHRFRRVGLWFTSHTRDPV